MPIPCPHFILSLPGELTLCSLVSSSLNLSVPRLLWLMGWAESCANIYNLFFLQRKVPLLGPGSNLQVQPQGTGTNRK